MFNSTSVPLKILNIENDGSHIFVEVKINGKPAATLIDTGASRSVFDKERIRLYEENKTFIIHEKLSTGLGTNSMPTAGIQVSHLKIGKLELNDFDIILLDLSHVNDSYASMGLQPIDGVIGNDILVRYRAKIDLSKNVLSLNLSSHLL